LQPNLPPNSGGNGVLNNYSDCHGHIHTNANGDSSIYAYGYSHGNCDSNADRDAVAAAYTYATASADTAASALALSGSKETREFPASNLFKKLDQRRARPLQGVRSAS
jgi:hypothetical protein